MSPRAAGLRVNAYISRQITPADVICDWLCKNPPCSLADFDPFLNLKFHNSLTIPCNLVEICILVKLHFDIKQLKLSGFYSYLCEGM